MQETTLFKYHLQFGCSFVPNRPPLFMRTSFSYIFILFILPSVWIDIYSFLVLVGYLITYFLELEW